MPVISPRKLQDRSDSILDAARTAFAEHGFENTSVAQIARLAGISDGLLYRYFRNKRDVLNEVLRRFYERTMIDLEAIAAQERPFAAQLEELIRRHLQTFVDDVDLCRLFFAEVRTQTDYAVSPIRALNQRYTSIVTGLVQKAASRGEIREGIDPRLVRDLIFGTVEHRAWAAVQGRQIDVNKTAADLVAIVMSGLAPSGQGAS
ncbi:MAG: TetR/AcrR family transcriptional regulator [Beijerinckiaceae bacterium]|nr:TetR/AcrR family transcriptional regulator [Beijerinckiaceae bacterium]